MTTVAPGAAEETDTITQARLGLSGGLLSFDVNKTDPLPLVQIDDIESASWWLLSLYGAETAETIIQFAVDADAEALARPLSDDGFERHREITVDFSAGSLLEALRRIALAVWLKRWWPSESGDAPGEVEGVPRLREWWLDTEIGTLAFDLEEVLDPDYPLSDMLLSPHLATIARTRLELRSSMERSSEEIAVAELLEEASRVALETVDPATAGLDLLEEVDRVSNASFDEEWQELFPRDAGNAEGAQQRQSDFALAAGGAPISVDDRRPDGMVPVDVRFVPARVFSLSPWGLLWYIVEDEEGVRCEVRAELADEAPANIAPGAFVARIEYGGVVTTVGLRRVSPGDRELSGTAHLDATASRGDLDITVHELVSRRGAPEVRPADARRADLETIGAFVKKRAHTPGSEIGGDRWDAPFAAEYAPRNEREVE